MKKNGSPLSVDLRRELYEQVLTYLLLVKAAKLVGYTDPYHVCTLLHEFADYGGGRYLYSSWPLIGTIKNVFPEFYMQKPKNRHPNNAWWPTGAIKPRIAALEKAIELTYKTK